MNKHQTRSTGSEKRQTAVERIDEFLRQNNDWEDERIELARWRVFGEAALPLKKAISPSTVQIPPLHETDSY